MQSVEAIQALQTIDLLELLGLGLSWVVIIAHQIWWLKVRNNYENDEE